MKEQEVYVKVPVGEAEYYAVNPTRQKSFWIKPLTALVFTPEEFEAEKKRIASEAWDAAVAFEEDKRRLIAYDNGHIEPAPDKDTYISSLTNKKTMK